MLEDVHRLGGSCGADGPGGAEPAMVSGLELALASVRHLRQRPDALAPREQLGAGEFLLGHALQPRLDNDGANLLKAVEIAVCVHRAERVEPCLRIFDGRDRNSCPRFKVDDEKDLIAYDDCVRCAPAVLRPAAHIHALLHVELRVRGALSGGVEPLQHLVNVAVGVALHLGGYISESLLQLSEAEGVDLPYLLPQLQLGEGVRLCALLGERGALLPEPVKELRVQPR